MAAAHWTKAIVHLVLYDWDLTFRKKATGAIETYIRGILPPGLAHAPKKIRRTGDPSGLVLDYLLGDSQCTLVMTHHDLLSWIVEEAERLNRGEEPFIQDGPFLAALLKVMFHALPKPQAKHKLFQRLPRDETKENPQKDIQKRLWDKKDFLKQCLAISAKQSVLFDKAQSYDAFLKASRTSRQRRGIKANSKGQPIYNKTFDTFVSSQNQSLWDDIHRYEEAMADRGVEGFHECQLRHRILDQLGHRD